MIKKILTIISVFIVTLLMMPVGNNTVNAGSLTPPKTDYVAAYGALIKKNNDMYGSVYALRQSRYLASEPALDATDGTSLINTNLMVNANDHLCATNAFDSSWDVIRNSFCKGSNLNPPLAYFELYNSGNLTVGVQPDVYIDRLNIYYIIAGVTENDHSATSMAFCAASVGVKICEHAKYIDGMDPATTGNWKSTNKNGKVMLYTESNLVANGFELDETSGGKEYHSFNVIENMIESNKKLAQVHGAYVFVTMTVSMGEGTPQVYHINTPILSTKKFTDVRSVTEGNSGQIKTYTNAMSDARNADAAGDSTYALRNDSIGGHIDHFAALVGKVEGAGETFQGMHDLLDQFDKYVKPVIEIALGILLAVRGTLLVVAIVKASDEPEVRKTNIKHLVTLFVSVFVVMSIVWFMKDIVLVMSDFIMGNK